jgi:GTPase SAR1 family protein
LPPGIIPTQEISDVQFIANGKRAVSCDYLWASDGQALAKLDTCYHAFSQDQSKLFVYGQGGATLYDTNTGQKTATFPLNSRSGFANFSPDGKRLVTSFGGLTQIWDTATGKEIVALEKRVSCSAMLKNIDYYIESYYQESKGCAVFNSDGSKIVTVSNHVARIWEVSTGQELFVLKHEDYLYGAAFSPDSKLVVVAADRNVQVWDVATGQKLAVLRDGGDRNINALFFTPDGKLLTASGPTLHLWDMETSKEIAVMSGHTKTIWEIGLTDNGEKIISFAKSQGIEERRFWDAKTGKALEQTCAAYEKHGASLTAAFRSRISKEEVSDDNFSVFISFVLNSYCPPEETGLSIASFEKLQFWMPLFSDLKALTEAAHQFIGRHEWTCDERRKFLLNTDNCPLDPPVPDGMDQATAKYWRMAKAGDVEMQYVTSLNYSNGKGVPANPEKRLEWLRKAAEGGHPAAQAILGLDYWEGYGVQQDRKEAAKWFLRAAERGQLDAQFMMCVVYYAGLGMTKDGKEAFKWCTKVVEKQNFSEDYRTTTGSAYYFLGNMYQNGYGVDQDFEKAAKFYKVASLGNEDAIKPVVVTSISANSQAEKLGIQVGDVFTHYEGKPVLNTNFFIAYRNAEPDEGLPKELKVQRDGETLIFQVLPGKIGVNLQDK